MIAVSRRLGCEAVVDVGSTAEALPHTRMPTVTGSTTNRDLARRLGLAAPSYQGVTGLVGVLHAELDRAGVPSISLRVGIPHYLVNAEHPTAVAALQTHIGHVVGMPVAADHRDDIDRWRQLHDEVVEGDPQLGPTCACSSRSTTAAPRKIPSADDLGAEFERFLRTQRDDETRRPDPRRTSGSVCFRRPVRRTEQTVRGRPSAGDALDAQDALEAGVGDPRHGLPRLALAVGDEEVDLHDSSRSR